MYDFSNTPAVIGTEKWCERSSKYNFVSTDEIVNVFEQNNWNVHKVSQVHNQKRTQHKKDFSKHLVTFTNPDLKEVNGIVPEILVINSHDGSTPFKMLAGFFRFVCANGMIVSDGQFEPISVRHKKLAPEIIEEGIKRYIDIVPEIVGKTEEMNYLIMNPVEQLQLSTNIINRIWEDDKPFHASTLIEYRRSEDKERTLFNTYNVIQENIMKGGITSNFNTKTGKKRKSREITNITKSVKINQILWEETDKFLQAA